MATSRGYSDRTVTYYINNDLMYGKGSIADLECLNVYFRKVLQVAVYSASRIQETSKNLC